MKLLALDTATEACSVALLITPPGSDAAPTGSVAAAPIAPGADVTPVAPGLDAAAVPAAAAAPVPAGGAQWFVRELEPGRGHAEIILSMVQEVLAEGGVRLAELTALAFGRGPGAFTGVRLAASVTQGLAFGAGLAVVPVSDLTAVAQQVLALRPEAASVLVCNDARMREVYWSGCPRGSDGLALDGMERVGAPETVLPASDLPRPIVGAGRGFKAYSELALRLGNELAAIDPEALPRAREIALLARRQVLAGQLLRPELALPVYLRDDVARPQPQSRSQN